MTTRPRILCLDDEPHVLEGLRRSLGAPYSVVTTTEPQDALNLLADSRLAPFAAIVSDMRMPQMTGVAVLEQARQTAPDTTRVLLTGDADLQSAMGAINQGNVFRFILKPCPSDVLTPTIAAAVEQHRLVRSERELLQGTLKGCVDALMDTLAMAQPALFSRAGRLRRLVEKVCVELDVEEAWQIEMAAQLGEIGAITLPPTMITALRRGTPSGHVEAEMLAELPRIADGVFARIPRVEAVREIIRQQLPTDRVPTVPLPADATLGARLLQCVREYDALTYRGMPPALALTTLAIRNVHETETVKALAKVVDAGPPDLAVREITIEELAVGQELATDVRGAKGLLLASRGQVISERLLTRVRNFAATTGLRGHILVVDP